MSQTDSDWSLYPYDPNKALPVVWSVIVFGLGIFHYVQGIHRYHWPRFGWMMIWATSVWLAGFICRAYSVFNVQNIPLYICQYVLILAGPPIYAAAETFILGRLFAYLPYHAPIHPGRVLSTFIILGIAVETISANGAAKLADNTNPADPKEVAARALGITLIKAALLLQACIEVIFFSLVAMLQWNCTRAGGHFPHNVKVLCRVLYVTSTMMLVRCIVRAIEGFESGDCSPGASGHCGVVTSNEWFLWVFEVANITIFITLLAIFTPGKYLSRDDKRFLDQHDGVTERNGPGFGQIDRRRFISTVIDPFNVRALIRGQKPFEPFWLQDWPVAEGSFAARHGKRADRMVVKLQSTPKGVYNSEQQV